ncbi:hypothetical protein FVR03_15945 [Pontibacter qinzhouensis]|uniref:Uncharacterized protein n=1 Tax=Pontibacter qinzhouensis TaxID=2603253 RepID=A0A5C8JFF5_9BACT|nr:hypothetical protein [Pontibacter qinzhouensis]TXK37185.1 hypothetical protein FVR03_15945 [Pontibacter qinzhouensis]
MKKDIDFGLVEGISIAVATSPDELGAPTWNVYLINNNAHALTNVLIASTGYGVIDGAEVKTSTLRHMFEQVEAKSFVQIEPIDPGIFHLNNEYWVSYYVGNNIYDKKFIFVPESITEDNLIEISMLQMQGVLHS